MKAIAYQTQKACWICHPKTREKLEDEWVYPIKSVLINKTNEELLALMDIAKDEPAMFCQLIMWELMSNLTIYSN